MQILDNTFQKDTNKFKRGLYNELAIAGNLTKKGYQTKVLDDHNPNYDIVIEKDNIKNYVECKLDCLSHKTNNLYFEVWNYTYNRHCGITNDNNNTLYCHTFKYRDKWVFIINYRKVFIEILKQMPQDKIKVYNNTYYINGQLVGDKALLVDVETFLSLYKGTINEMLPAFKW